MSLFKNFLLIPIYNNVYPKHCQNYDKDVCSTLGFSMEDSCYSMKRLKRKYLLLLANKFIEKAHDPRNAKEYFESFLRKKT